MKVHGKPIEVTKKAATDPDFEETVNKVLNGVWSCYKITFPCPPMA
jgi:hypothetical protein